MPPWMFEARVEAETHGSHRQTISMQCNVTSSKIALYHRTMSRFSVLVCLAALGSVAFASAAKDVTKLQIGVKHKPSECTQKAKAGDTVAVHYSGALTDGTVFDSSYTRGDPIKFTLGKGQVIKGWDQGIAGMCPGEKRKLQIPSHLGYGDRGSPPKIPGGATLVFDTELVSIG